MGGWQLFVAFIGNSFKPWIFSLYGMKQNHTLFINIAKQLIPNLIQPPMSHKIADITTKQRSQQLIPASTVPREHPHPPSLFLNVWEFDHDPDDNFMINAILQRQKKQNSARMPNRKALPKQKIRSIQRKSSHKLEECHQFKESIRNGIQIDGNYKYPIQSTLKPIDPQLQLNSNTSNQIDSPNYQKKNTIEQNIEQRHLSIKTNAISKQIIIQPRQQLISNSNRDLQIYSHKLMSNFNLLVRQLKQLILWNQIEILQMDIEGYRRSVVKGEIECRKLRISLRNGGSNGYLGKGRVVNKKNIGSMQKCNNVNSEKHKKISDAVSPQKLQLPKKVSKKQLQLQQQLTKYKQLATKLSIKQSQITNYCRVLKSQLSSLSLSINHRSSQTDRSQYHPNNQIPTQSKITKNIPTSIPTSIRKQQFNLLIKKRQLLQVSLEQSVSHFQSKINNLKEEIRLLGRELEIVEGKIYGGRSNGILGVEKLKGIRNGRMFHRNGKLSSTKLIRKSENTLNSVKSCSKTKRVSLQETIVQKQIYTDRYPTVYERHLPPTLQSQSENSQKDLKISIEVHSFKDSL